MKVLEKKQSDLATLSDEIRRMMARISRGEASPKDSITVNKLIDRRVELRVQGSRNAAEKRAREKIARQLDKAV